nr:probable 1-acyl-sn-glycerol-3-phosphate acyltransferase 4 [Ipomoea batatas]GME10181.1 probable 1-acyl-sn-glycerol-3-phosphate acyltransferase 4 [Ipomoea batatas]
MLGFNSEESMTNLESTEGSKHCPLSTLRIIRGVICLAVLLSTALMFLIYFVPVAVLLLRSFSINCSRKVVSLLFGIWLGLWPFLFEKINKTKVIFSGDRVPAGERVLLIANHRTEVDWMYLWDLALRKGCLGHMKYVLKKSLMKLPIFGWGFHILEFIPLERKWEVDEPVMQSMLSTFTNPQDPLWLAVFPEGTDFTEQKCIRSQKFAAENGFPVMKNVLLPKSKGFTACLDTLRHSLDAVYDITIAYKNRCPSLIDNVFGVDPSEVHMHVRHIPIEEMPVSEGVGAWLMETFESKDRLLSDFIANGHFPHQGTEEQLSTAKCLINFAVVIAFTTLFIFLTFYSSIWFKVYVGFSCVYLASASYLDIKL